MSVLVWALRLAFARCVPLTRTVSNLHKLVSLTSLPLGGGGRRIDDQITTLHGRDRLCCFTVAFWRRVLYRCWSGRRVDCNNLVDLARSHMLVSKIKPCMFEISF